MFHLQKRGFTLVEMMVVIAIVGFLASVILSSVNSTRAKGENTQRNQIAEEYRKALAMYYDANGGVYPDTGNTITTYCLGDYPTLGVYTDNAVCSYSYSTSNENATLSNAVNTYLKGLPAMKIVQFNFAGFTYKGPTYICTSTSCKTATVTWALQGANQKCIRNAGVSSFFGTTICSLTLN